MFLKVLSSLLDVFRPVKNDLLPNQSLSFIPLIIDVEKEPRKKNPIIIQKIFSSAMEDEKAWPDLTISVRGSKGSKLISYIFSSLIIWV